MADDHPNVLDLRGLKCPMPVLKTRKAMLDLTEGDRIWVETTDPLAAIDLPNFCQLDGHTLVDTQSAEGYQRFLIAKGKPAG